MQVGQKCNIEDMRRAKNTPPFYDFLSFLRGKHRGIDSPAAHHQICECHSRNDFQINKDLVSNTGSK